MRQIHIVILKFFKENKVMPFILKYRIMKKKNMVYACHSQKVEFNTKSRGKAGQTW